MVIIKVRKDLLWNRSFHTQSLFIVKKACSTSSENFCGCDLWVTAIANCYVPAEVGEENRRGVGRRIRCSTADLQVLLRCMPHFILLPFYSQLPSLGCIWGPAGELDFTFTNFFPFLAEASPQSTCFQYSRNLSTYPVC